MGGTQSFGAKIALIVGVACTVAVLGVAVFSIVDPRGMYTDSAYCSLRQEDRGPYHEDVAPYRGDGPHPVLMLRDESRPQHHAGELSSELPGSWRASSTDDIQLVVCETGSTKLPKETCRYHGGRTVVHETVSYYFSVIEAATGELLRQFTVYSTDYGGCERVVVVPDEEYGSEVTTVDSHVEPTVAVLLGELKHYVEDFVP
ncbi:hypothetical protein [Actinophytocola sp. NPDC049390]|uniref:hypothetical protein n=1 Tax=Actinophytocola sp. NPDC049390 TaxID=3363894 RepID=UPI0037AC2E99